MAILGMTTADPMDQQYWKAINDPKPPSGPVPSTNARIDNRGYPLARRRSGGGNRPYSCRYQWQSSGRYQTPARRLADLASLRPMAGILLVARTIWIAVLGLSILFLIV